MSALVAGGETEARRRRARGYLPDRAAAGSPDEAVRVKVETDVDIKDYAENTMNELLGWYGYDKLDTRGLNLKNLNQHFPTSSSSSSPMRHDDDLSEEDTGRSRSPHLEPESTSTGTITCAWCLKSGLKLFTLKTTSGKTKAFCSEPCFNQCRRAAFKKNRVCNWCRHVRHTVNYVDFKDGDDQLQFCGDKCLNQYKMQIFCKETQAYLQMNPHLQQEEQQQLGAAASKLITPDLWLRDCQESLNGAAASLEDSPKTNNGPEIEDLSHPSKHPPPDRDTPTDPKDKRTLEMCNALASYLRDDPDKNSLDRKKRVHDSEKDSLRKRQKISSSRHKPGEAPPHAHTSSSHSQNRLFPTSQFQPPPLSACSPNQPPAAHSNKSLPPHPSIPAPLMPPLPPPPPLLNSDFLHSPFSSFLPPSQQQHLDALLRMQRQSEPSFAPHSHLFQDPMLPLLRNAAPHHLSNSFLQQPNTVMLPYPVFVPLPIPVPIPLPLSSFLQDKKKLEDTNNQTCFVDSNENSESNSSAKTSTKLKSSSADKNNIIHTPGKKEKQHTIQSDGSSYAVTNNDSNGNKLVLTRNKTH